MDLIATEGPALLGYLAVAAALAVGLGLVILLDPETRARRARNRATRIRRHAAQGCDVCRLRLLLEGGRTNPTRLDLEASDADVAAWLDYPTGGPR